jgi:hypothetical protein
VERSEGLGTGRAGTETNLREELLMLCRYAGFDPAESPIIPRGPVSRFTEEQISEMLAMAADGANSNEIGHALDLKPEAVRAKLWRLGIRLESRARVGHLCQGRIAACYRSVTPNSSELL